METWIEKSRPFAALGFGEIMLALVAEAGEPIRVATRYHSHIGGTEGNVMAGIANLYDLRTGMITALPANSHGEKIVAGLRHWGVSNDGIIKDDSPKAKLGMYFLYPGIKPAEDRYIYDRNDTSFMRVALERFPKALLPDTQVFYLSGVTLALLYESLPKIIELLEICKAHGTKVAVDFNYRQKLWGPHGGEAAAAKAFGAVLPYADYFNLSRESAEMTFGLDHALTAEELAQEVALEYSIRYVSITERDPVLSSFEVTLYDSQADGAGHSKRFVSLPWDGRTGSGDACVAGVLGKLIQGGTPQEAADMGGACGALKCTVLGDALLKNESEVLRFLGSDGKERNR